MSVVLEDKPRSATSSKSSELTQLIRQYGCGPIQLTGTNDAFYERHLIFDNVMDAAAKWRRLRYDTQPTFFLWLMPTTWYSTSPANIGTNSL